jgi:hypothetical protein
MEFTLRIKSDNAAMQTAEDVVDALKTIISKIRTGRDGGKVMDANGNSVGTWDLCLPESEEEEA